MKLYLTGILVEYLCVITCRVRKINKLFGYKYNPVTLKKIESIGKHIIQLITCNADSISRLTNSQVQYIID